MHSENPEFKPTPASGRLAVEVEQFKKRRKLPAVVAHAHEPDEPLRGTLSAMLGKIPPSTPEQEADLEEERRPITQQHLEEIEQKRIEAHLNAQVPELYREPFNLDRVDPEVDREEVSRVLGWQYGPQGLWVVGSTGHSKSRAVGALLCRLIVKDRRRVRYMTGGQFGNFCTEAFYDAASTDRRLNELVTPDILVLDDLAKKWTKSTQEGAFEIF